MRWFMEHGGNCCKASVEDWRKALDKVVPAVVVLQTNACQAFDTEFAGACYVTGFVDFLYDAYIIYGGRSKEKGGTPMIYISIYRYMTAFTSFV